MTWKSPRIENADRDATPIAKSLEVVASKLGAAPPRALSAVFEQWGETVGPEIARHTSPQSLTNGVLVVTVDDQRWATQLKWMTTQLVDRLNEASKTQAVERIEVRFKAPGSPK